MSRTLQLPYIPQVVFPFVVLYGSDELSVFEMVMTVFMWWGHSFFATYPHPPVHIVGTYVQYSTCSKYCTVRAVSHQSYID